MSIFPGTGIPRDEETVAATCVVVCGESPSDVFKASAESLAGWRNDTIVDGFREFHLRRFTQEGSGKSLNVFVGGLGSSSVELILQEGTLSGMKKFILTGSCASLRQHIAPGEVVIPNSVILRSGGLSEYFNFPPLTEIHSSLQAELASHLRAKSVEFHFARNISTDAFYGVGASQDTKGRACYGGARLKGGRLPQGVELAIQNPFQADTLDMEVAPFFCLGHEIDGIEVSALKIVSNPIPWSDNFDQISIESAVSKGVRLAIDFAVAITRP